MEVKNHPTFKMRFRVFRKHLFIYGAMILLGNISVFAINKWWPILLTPSAKNMVLIICVPLVLVYGFAIFILQTYRLYNVKCPVCNSKTKTKDYRKILPNKYSAFCKQCNILWDLGVNSD